MPPPISKQIDFDAVIIRSTNKLWGSHCVVPADVSAYFLSKDIKRLLCTMNAQETFHAGLMPIGKGTWVIKINQMLLKKYRLNIGDTAHLVLQEDSSEFGLPIPEELTEMLVQDEEGWRHFDALTSGKKRTLIYMVSQKKKSEKRIEMSIKILDHLKENAGKINYKLLYV